MKCLERVKNALSSISDNVGHYEALKADAPYIVWAEDSGDNVLHGDNRMQVRAVSGTIDLYTKEEHDPMFDQIEAALTDEDVAFYLNSVQYEDSTKLIHFEWVFEVS